MAVTKEQARKYRELSKYANELVRHAAKKYGTPSHLSVAGEHAERRICRFLATRLPGLDDLEILGIVRRVSFTRQETCPNQKPNSQDISVDQKLSTTT